MPMPTSTEQKTVVDFAKQLILVSDHCDHARSFDGQGFSGYDADFGNDICARLRKGVYPTERQFAAIKKMVWKYRSQIMPEVMDMDRFPSRAAAERAFKAKMDAVVYVPGPVDPDKEFVPLAKADPCFHKEHETSAAVLFIVMGKQCWFPKTCTRGDPNSENVVVQRGMLLSKCPAASLNLASLH